MAFYSSILAALALVTTEASPVARAAASHFVSHRPASFAPPTPLEASTNYAILHQTASIAPSSKHLLRSMRAATPAPLIASDGGTGYAINVAFGNATLQMILDTGSSDTWTADRDLSCVDSDGDAVDADDCHFGPLYDGTLEGGEIPDRNFNITYGDGEFLTGVMGYTDIGIAGTILRRQEVAAVDYAYWDGDGQTSGLVGFAYPSLTAAYEGDDPSQDSRARQLPYDPVVASAAKQGLFTSFSLAIERGDEGGRGYLALGGLPPIDFDHTFTSTPIEITRAAAAVVGSQLSYYSITPEGFVMGGGSRDLKPRSVGTGFSVIVDSGTTLIYLPTTLAAAINLLFQPPARYISSSGLFEVPCSAKAPTFAVRINGTDFYVSGQDLVLAREQAFDETTGLCVTGIQMADGTPAILGDVFLRNVVAVFDVGAGEMRFAKHTDY